MNWLNKRQQKPTREQIGKALAGYELMINEIKESNLKDDVKETLIVLLQTQINVIKNG